MTYFRPDELRSPGRGPEDGPGPAFVQSQNILFGAMAGSLVIIGVVLAFTGLELATPDPIWPLIVVLAAAVGSWAAVLALGVPRLAGASLPARSQTLMILRIALLEAPAILGVSLAFVSGSLLVYLLPMLSSLLGLWLFARPSVVRAAVSRAA